MGGRNGGKANDIMGWKGENDGAEEKVFCLLLCWYTSRIMALRRGNVVVVVVIGVVVDGEREKKSD